MIFPKLDVVGGFQGRCGTPQKDGCIRLKTPINRHITGMVAWRFSLFVGAIVLFIDNHQSEIVQRGKYRTPCSDDNTGQSFADPGPFIITFTVVHSAVKHRNVVTKS